MIYNVQDLRLFEHTWSDFLAKTYGGKEKLHHAIHYAMTGAGKRVRALAGMQVAREYGADSRIALSAAVATEMVHAYSLCHDDLPCMDDDDWRRGRPSLHKAFDEATALLAGDALLTDSFRVLSDPEFFADSSLVSSGDQIKQVSVLSRAAGGHGMVVGQARDLWWTGKEGVTEEALQSIHLEKTGALMGASFALGAAAVSAPKKDIELWYGFGKSVGVAFQAIDDTLDDLQGTGKSSGKDLAQGKLTYLRFHSKESIQSMTHRLTEEALSKLPRAPSSELRSFVESLVFRNR